jgi:hypothetical protein
VTTSLVSVPAANYHVWLVTVSMSGVSQWMLSDGNMGKGVFVEEDGMGAAILQISVDIVGKNWGRGCQPSHTCY